MIKFLLITTRREYSPCPRYIFPNFYGSHVYNPHDYRVLSLGELKNLYGKKLVHSKYKYHNSYNNLLSKQKWSSFDEAVRSTYSNGSNLDWYGLTVTQEIRPFLKWRIWPFLPLRFRLWLGKHFTGFIESLMEDNKMNQYHITLSVKSDDRIDREKIFHISAQSETGALLKADVLAFARENKIPVESVVYACELLPTKELN